jgi:hypothetical protein
VACLPLLVAASIVVVPSGMGGVRVSQISGTLPGTLYPGVHFVTPLVESVQTFDLRDHLFTAGVVERARKAGRRKECLSACSRSKASTSAGGYGSLSPRSQQAGQRAGAHAAAVDKELVPPVVASAWRELAPNTPCAKSSAPSAKRCAPRRQAIITRKLAPTALWWKR